MKTAIQHSIIAIATLFISSAALAQAAAQPPVQDSGVPEPASIALFLLGIVGLFFGRRSSRARQKPLERPLDGKP